jgi:hypothetical protein
MQLSVIFANGGWELEKLRCDLNPAAFLARVVRPGLFLEKYKLAKLEGLPSAHEF